MNADISTLIRFVKDVATLSTEALTHSGAFVAPAMRPHITALLLIPEERAEQVITVLRERSEDESFIDLLAGHGLTGVELRSKVAIFDMERDAWNAAQAAGATLDDEEGLEKLKRALEAAGIPLGSLGSLIPGGDALAELLQLILSAIEHSKRKKKWGNETGGFIFPFVRAAVARLLQLFKNDRADR